VTFSNLGKSPGLQALILHTDESLRRFNSALSSTTRLSMITKISLSMEEKNGGEQVSIPLSNPSVRISPRNGEESSPEGMGPANHRSMTAL
jgi:hypothetical protein